MTGVVDVVVRAPAAIFVPVDTFLVSAVPGPPLGPDRPARCALRFGVLDIRFAAGPVTTMAPGLWLMSTRTASGVYVTYGELEGPDNTRRRLIGGPVDVTLFVDSAYYRSQYRAPVVRLENLDPDPAVARAAVTPTVVALQPGVRYPFPARLSAFGLVRGQVRRSADGPGVDGVPVSATAPAAGSTPALNDVYVTDYGGQFVFAVPDAGQTVRRLTLTAAGASAVTVDVGPSNAVTAKTIVIP